MHPNHFHSSSSPASETTSTTIRLSNSILQPPSEPTGSYPQPSELRSDEDWHFAMRSDSDLANPIKEQQLSSNTLTNHSSSSNFYSQQPTDSTYRQLSSKALDKISHASLVEDYKLNNNPALASNSNSCNRPRTLEQLSPSVPQHLPRPEQTPLHYPTSHFTPPTLPHNPTVHHNYYKPAASEHLLQVLTHPIEQEEQAPPNHSSTIGATSANDLPHTSATNSVTSPSSLKRLEHKLSGLTMVFKENKLRLGNASLNPGNLFQKRDTPIAAGVPGVQTTNHDGHASALVDPSRRVPAAEHALWSHPPINGTDVQRSWSTHSEGMVYSRAGVDLLEQGKRPVSTPAHASSQLRDEEKLNDTDVFFEKSSVMHVSDSMLPEIYQNSMKPTTKHLSFLECVCQTLGGTKVYKRKRFMNASDAYIWLTPDLAALMYRTVKRGVPPEVHTLPLSNVRKLKGCEREITIEVNGEKKPTQFLFASKERANVWLSGLCCLVPANATVKSRNRRWQQRGSYDPLSDIWQGKPLTIRKRLNEYIFLETIGRGSSAKVKLVFSSTERKFYAMKVLMKTALRQRYRERTKIVRMTKDGKRRNGNRELAVTDVNEIAVMKHLDHENLTKMIGVFDDTEEDRIYIVLEYMAGRGIMTSAGSIETQRLGENRVRSILVDVLCGLEYLHRNGIAHRDIKPENLLKTGDGTVKISDFGSAIIYSDDDLSSEEGTGSTFGTPAFTAPEICGNESSPPCPRRCFAADIWSLGASIFFMIYGKIPFSADGVFQIYDVICKQDVEFPETPVVANSLQSLIQIMLEKNPRKRATISDIIESPWLTENVQVAEKLEALRGTIQQHALETAMGSANNFE